MDKSMDDIFKSMDEVVNKFFANTPKSYVAYCDYISHLIAGNLKALDNEKLLSSVGKIKWDIDRESCRLVTTKKTIEVEDRYGKKYLITIEEA